MKLLTWLLLTWALSACAVETKYITPEKTHTSKTIHSKNIANLNAYSPRFLYMAAQTALQDHHNTLARQFLEALNQKLKLSKDDEEKWSIEPRLQLVQLWLHQQQISKSKALLESLLQHYPLSKAIQKDEILRLHTLYARILAAQGQYADASDALTRLLSLSPDFLPARHLQIALFMETKHWDLAHIAIQTAFQRHDTAALRKLNANVFLYEKKYTQALKSLKEMQRLAPDASEVPLLQSDIAMQQHHEKQALHYLKSFLSTHPDDKRVKNKLASLYIRTGHPKDAVRLYQELAVQMPNQASIASTLGVLFYQQKKIKQATVYFERAYQLEPKGRGHAFYLAASLEFLKQKQRARSLYQKVSKDDGLWVESQLRLAGMDFESKKFNVVQQRLLPLLNNHPEANHG